MRYLYLSHAISYAISQFDIACDISECDIAYDIALDIACKMMQCDIACDKKIIASVKNPDGIILQANHHGTAPRNARLCKNVVVDSATVNFLFTNLVI